LRLYVDCDETLITWHSGNKFLREPVPSPRVVKFVESWAAEHGPGSVLIWAEASEAWARECAGIALPELAGQLACAAKFELPLRPGDVFLDNDPYPMHASQALHPKRLP
jgi:hypothetical protein